MADWYETHPTPAELRAVLGEQWAICRPTPQNQRRHGRCITRHQYERACAEALSRRAGQ